MTVEVTGEFSAERMERCLGVHRDIMQTWPDDLDSDDANGESVARQGDERGGVDYRVTCSASIQGKELSELEELTYSVCAGEETTELALIELLVVLHLVEEESRQRQAQSPGDDAPLQVTIRTIFSREEACALLAGAALE